MIFDDIQIVAYGGRRIVTWSIIVCPGLLLEYLTKGSQLKLQHEVNDHSENEQEAEQGDDVHPVDRVLHGHLFEELRRALEVAVVLGTLEFRPIVAVHGNHGALKTVPHVAHVREEL